MVVLRGDLFVRPGRVEEWCRASQDLDWTRVQGSAMVLLHARDAPFSPSRAMRDVVVCGNWIASCRQLYRATASIMEKDRQNVAHEGEMISDREIRSVICYLDPESAGVASDLAVIVISLLVIAALVCAVWFLFRLCGL